MSFANKTVTVERRAEVVVYTCDASGCRVEHIHDQHGEAGDMHSEQRWFILTRGGFTGDTYDACSPACLLKIVQSPEVTS